MPSAAKLTLPAYLANNMVLQQRSVMKFTGTAAPNSFVRIYTSWNKENLTDSVGASGEFSIKVSIPEASQTEYFVRISELEKKGSRLVATETKVFSNILIGEVWLCSGQSNMDMPIQGWGMVNNNAEEVRNANYPMIRLFKVAAVSADHPSDDLPVSMSWTVCAPSSVPEFSAAAYFFGRELYKSLNIPIGLVQSAWGGSNAEAWVPLEDFKTVSSAWARYSAGAQYSFNKDSVKKYFGWNNEHQVPTLLYNKMIHPLKSYPIRGAIWYQGETNAWGSNYYTQLMDTLISSWRKDWGYKFPFYTVQLAGYMKQVDVQPSSNWAALRWDQQKTAVQMDSTGMATAIDIGNQDDIHPKNKQEVGRRLALLALRKTYGKDVVAEAPVPVRWDVGSTKTTIVFNRKIHARADSIPVGFIYGSRRSSATGKVATAKIVNDTTIEITSPTPYVRPVVRYNWADYPIGNLYGENNLPVLPFRTNDEHTMELVGIGKVYIAREPSSKPQDVYSLDGTLLKKNASEDDIQNLRKGIYIIGSKKTLVR